MELWGWAYHQRLIQVPLNQHRSQLLAYIEFIHFNNLCCHGRSYIGYHQQFWGGKECTTTRMMTMTTNRTTTTMKMGMAAMFQGWQRDMVEGQASLWDREDEGTMPNGEGEYERDGGVKIGAPTSNGRSNTNAPLGLEYPTVGMSNDTKMMTIQAPMALPLPPQSNPNMGSYHLFQSSHRPELLCASHSWHGWTWPSKPSLSPMPLSPPTTTTMPHPQFCLILNPITTVWLPSELHPRFWHLGMWWWSPFILQNAGMCWRGQAGGRDGNRDADDHRWGWTIPAYQYR